MTAKEALRKALLHLNSVKVEGKMSMKNQVAGIELVEMAYNAALKCEKEAEEHAKHHDEQRNDAQHQMDDPDGQECAAADDHND